MKSLDIDSVFTNIPLEETIEICTKNLFKSNKTVHCFKKSEFKDLLHLATKDSFIFIFISVYYIFIFHIYVYIRVYLYLLMAHHEQNWLHCWTLEYRPIYY